jgi:hypothetical protein
MVFIGVMSACCMEEYLKLIHRDTWMDACMCAFVCVVSSLQSMAFYRQLSHVT